MEPLVSDPLEAGRDPGLPWLRLALDPRQAQPRLARVPALAARLSGARLRAVRVLRHKPGRRCLIAYDLEARDAVGGERLTVLGKVRARGTDTTAVRLLEQLWRADFDAESADGVCVPEPLGAVPELGMWLQSKVPGETATDLLAKPGGANLAVRIADAVGKLHRCCVTPPRAHGIADELRILRNRLDSVASAHPPWRGRLERTADACARLGAGMPLAAPGTIHRDCYPDQLAVNGERIHILDLDLCSRGDPALDIGNFVGHMVEQGLRECGRPDALAEQAAALVERFGERTGARGAAVVSAYATLTLARHVWVSTLFAERRTLTTLLLELCEERLDLAPQRFHRVPWPNGEEEREELVPSRDLGVRARPRTERGGVCPASRTHGPQSVARATGGRAAGGGRPMGSTVAYLLKRFPRLSETFVLNEILKLRCQGLDVQVFALMDPREKQVQPEAARLCNEVTYLHRPNRFVSWSRLLAGAAVQVLRRPDGFLRVAWALVSVHRSLASLRHAVEGLWLAGDLRRRGIKHLHAHFVHSPAAVAYLAYLAGGPPFSFTAHAKDLYTTLPRNLRIRARAARFAVTCTRFNEQYLRDVLGPNERVPIHVLYHGTDLDRFTPDRSGAEPGRILSVGRLVPKKGFPVLIGALAHLDREGQRFTAEVFGEGPLREELERRLNEHGLGGRVTFHGARLQQEILAAYRRAAVFALAPVVTDNGDRDGIPNVLVEAMASGVPVVATRISGIPELIIDGVDGLLVEPNDPQGLAAAIARLLRDRGLADQLAGEARHRVERLFDLTANTRSLCALFRAQVRPTGPS